MTDTTSGHRETNVIETLQSLIVAFVVAMVFRSFVSEGFVIPTGSMAPTLLGAHHLVDSGQTGVAYPIDSREDPKHRFRIGDPIPDEYVGQGFRAKEMTPEIARARRMGDRLLVMKCLYPFLEPDRFDIVVFKNPVTPTGSKANYIKRLIGLPNETLWLVDGDVFAAPNDSHEIGRLRDFKIQRKPEYIQRAVWQPVFDSDFLPVAEHVLVPRIGKGQSIYPGPPLYGKGWTIENRAYMCNESDKTELVWDSARRAIDDWTAYDGLTSGYGINEAYAPIPPQDVIPVSDVRVAAAIEPKSNGLTTTLSLVVRGHRLTYTIDEEQASIHLENVTDHSVDQSSLEARADVDAFATNQVTSVEFWHVDQEASIFINGKRMASLQYDWLPEERTVHSYGTSSADEAVQRMPWINPIPLALSWSFEGSPLTMSRVQVERDLYYRPDVLGQVKKGDPDAYHYLARSTSPYNLAELGPDHFFMLGDNSAFSYDCRLWSEPAPIAAHQIDATRFVVHRKLLMGKAWVVYFPAPLSVQEKTASIIPDFGRMRFIR